MRGSRSHPGETRARGEAGSFPTRVQRFRHDFEYDDFIVNRPAAFRGGALGRRAGICGQSAELSVKCFRTSAYFSASNG